jgi:hypothetical protein
LQGAVDGLRINEQVFDFEEHGVNVVAPKDETETNSGERRPQRGGVSSFIGQPGHEGEGHPAILIRDRTATKQTGRPLPQLLPCYSICYSTEVI